MVDQEELTEVSLFSNRPDQVFGLRPEILSRRSLVLAFGVFPVVSVPFLTTGV